MRNENVRRRPTSFASRSRRNASFSNFSHFKISKILQILQIFNFTNSKTFQFANLPNFSSFQIFQVFQDFNFPIFQFSKFPSFQFCIFLQFSNFQISIFSNFQISKLTFHSVLPPHIPVEDVEQDRCEPEVSIIRQISHELQIGLLFQRGDGHVEGYSSASQNVPMPSHLVLEEQDVADLNLRVVSSIGVDNDQGGARTSGVIDRCYRHRSEAEFVHTSRFPFCRLTLCIVDFLFRSSPLDSCTYKSDPR